MIDSIAEEVNRIAITNQFPRLQFFKKLAIGNGSTGTKDFDARSMSRGTTKKLAGPPGSIPGTAFLPSQFAKIKAINVSIPGMAGNLSLIAPVALAPDSPMKPAQSSERLIRSSLPTDNKMWKINIMDPSRKTPVMGGQDDGEPLFYTPKRRAQSMSHKPTVKFSIPIFQILAGANF